MQGPLYKLYLPRCNEVIISGVFWTPSLCSKKKKTLSPPRSQPAGPYKHLCEVCGKAFESGKQLGGHKSAHRPLPILDSV
jgi:hypothetical protein